MPSRRRYNPVLTKRVCVCCGFVGTRGVTPVKPRPGQPWNSGRCKSLTACRRRRPKVAA